MATAAEGVASDRAAVVGDPAVEAVAVTLLAVVEAEADKEFCKFLLPLGPHPFKDGAGHFLVGNLKRESLHNIRYRKLAKH